MTSITSLPALYLDKLEQLFASSPTLQAAVDESPEVVRDEHVMNDYGWYLDTEGVALSGLRPLVIIAEQEFGATTDTMSADGGIGVVHSGTVGVLITDNSIYPGDNSHVKHRQSKRAFENLWGGILADVRRASGRDDNLLFAGYDMTMPSERTPVKERSRFNDYWQCAFSFRFGTEI